MYDVDNQPPGSMLHPHPAKAGSIMEQGVPVEVLDKAPREFSDEDAARLRDKLNPP
jgi:hypothetical protein